MSRTSIERFKQWQADAKPMLNSMMVVLYGAQDATTRSPQAMLSASDQLHAASSAAVRWIPSHRCPVNDLDGVLTRLARSYSEAGDLLAQEARKPGGPDRATLDRELTGLIGMLAVMWAVMKKQTAAESSV